MRLLLLLATCLCLLPIEHVHAEQSADRDTAATITVRITGITQPGQLVVLLYDRNGWLHPEAALQQLRIPIHTATPMRCQLYASYPQHYAIEAFLDLNGNGKLDMHWFPIPGPDEPVGFSNHYRPFAKPAFDKASFALQSPTAEITIHLH